MVCEPPVADLRRNRIWIVVFGGCRNWKSNDCGFFEWMNLNKAEGSSGGVNRREHGGSQRAVNDRQRLEFGVDPTDAMRKKIVSYRI